MVEEEEEGIMKNCSQVAQVLAQDCIIAPRMNLLTYYQRRGLEKV
jgi:hypothetical protein